MDSRAQFEYWVSDNGASPRAIHRGSNGDYRLMSTFSAWQVWQASRAAIEIEPPKFIDSREALKMGRMVDYSNGFGDAMDAYEASIKSVGISIKGESS